MTSRTTLASLINELRGMVNAGTADYSLGTANYWDDDQMQAALERQRTDHYRELLARVPSYAGGTVSWFNYYTGVENLEVSDGGTAVFYLEDAAGAKLGTALFAMDYRRGMATFLADTGGSSYFWYGRSYDLNRAAADIWKQKASYYATQFNFSTDNQRLDKGSVYKQCLEMAKFYEERSTSGWQVTTITRSDVDAGGGWDADER